MVLESERFQPHAMAFERDRFEFVHAAGSAEGKWYVSCQLPVAGASCRCQGLCRTGDWQLATPPACPRAAILAPAPKDNDERVAPPVATPLHRNRRLTHPTVPTTISLA